MGEEKKDDLDVLMFYGVEESCSAFDRFNIEIHSNFNQ